MNLGVRVALVAASFLALLSASPEALPCGAFVARNIKTVPSLEVEQTLIVFDAERQLEHFVRQVAIRDPSPGFGFVVPVPERPEVAKVNGSPFEKLARHFPVRSGASLAAGGGRRGSGSSSTAGGAPVTVLSRERIGSFTAFVLAASDAEALRKWLTDNRLLVAPEAAAWFEHYVKLRFFFVALRYEQPAGPSQAGKTRAETLRISFATPLPFYPYREPAHASTAAEPGAPKPARVLAVWLVSSRSYVPISLQHAGAHSTWKRPWLEHSSSQVARERVSDLLDASLARLLPRPADGQLTLQVFEDQKTQRTGFGDVVMVPSAVTPSVALSWEKAHKLMATLDPAYEAAP